MEREALITAMKSSISEVLETMFFLPLEFAGNTKPGELWDSDRGEIIVSKLNFTGPFAGYFVLFVPKELALSLAASFLGKDEASISQDHVAQTVKEIINMIAGSTFGIFDDQSVFDLDIPELVRFAELRKDHSDSKGGIFIAVNTLESRLAVQMIIGS